MPTLDFKGKNYVYAHHLSVPFRGLDIVPEKSMPKDGKPSMDDNLIIHGDNLHALKALLPQYAGKIKCIYIDPPYNTGNEGWSYNDKVNSPLMKEWLAKSANPVTNEDLERHDKWLCMMWPRLQLLRELLSDDGVIFVSIDDIEFANLRTIIEEIFPEGSFVASIVWEKGKKGDVKQILDEVVQKLIAKGITELAIAAAGHDLVKQIKDDALEWLLQTSEKLFIQKLSDNEIVLKLLATPFANLNWDMGDERTVYMNFGEEPAQSLNKNIFQPQYKSNYNGLEANVAAYINQSEATKWWHRLGTKGTEYHVQGWKKDKIYPDFLILYNDGKYLFLETKGNHLDNPDSAYKAQVFAHLTNHANRTIGEFKLLADSKEISFDLVYENEWKERLIEKGL